MNQNNTPTTLIELENFMKENCYNFDSYSICENAIYEGFGIKKLDKSFVWYYTERGQEQYMEYFDTESEIVEFAFHQIKADKWAKTHCIGFTTDKIKSRDLKNKLLAMNIGFFEDKIPYSTQKLIYRIFVLGCDIQKTIHLKEKYWTEK